MILLLTIPHEQESRFDTDRPYKERNEVNMIHLGDITKIHGNEIEPADCITFGSPCQDLSIAGRRAGLAGERSGLFMEAVRIIKEILPVADEIRKSGYFKYCLRKMASGGRYYVIKDGMVVRGAVLPVKLESLAKFGLRELADMVAKTTDAADVEDLSKREDKENA